MKRGEIYFADLDPVVGSEQGGIRPVLIIQNDLGNRFSPTVIVLPLTSSLNKAPLKTHVPVRPPLGGLKRPSLILCEQVRTLEKKRLKSRLGLLPRETLLLVDRAFALAVSGAIGHTEDAPPDEEQKETKENDERREQTTEIRKNDETREELFFQGKEKPL